MSRRGQWGILCLLLVGLGGPGCLPESDDSPAPRAKVVPHVQVVLTHRARGVVPGQRLTFKGELAGWRADGRVVVWVASVYAGSESAVAAVQLARDFAAGPEAVDARYKRGRFSPPIVVSGLVTQVQPDGYSVDLEGPRE